MPDKRKPRIVLDSVVLVSAFLTEGLAAELIARCREKATLYTAEEIIQEIRRVLLEEDHIRNRYKYTDTDVETFLSRFLESSTTVKALPDIQVIERDPKDNKILACAVIAQANYIVSRDLDLLDLGAYQGIQIVSPEDFIHYLRDK